MINNLSYLTQYYNAFSKMQIISRTDTDGVITGVNDNFCKISGYTKEALVGFSHNKIRHQDTKDVVFEKMWKTISSGKIWKGEIKNLTRKGGFYWTRSVIFPIFDNEKNIVEYISFREDITKRKLLELKVAKEDKFRREILHSQTNMVLLVHQKKGVIFMNNQCFIDLPFNSREEFLKERECICELFIENDDFLKPSTKERHWLKDFYEFPDKNHKAMIKNKKGEERIFLVDISEFKDNKNLIVVNLVNITELEECKEELNRDRENVKLLESRIDQELNVDGANRELLEELKSILTFSA